NPEIVGDLYIINDDLAYFRAWHPELVEGELNEENFSDTWITQPAWKWYSWDLDSDEAQEVPDVGAFSGRPHLFRGDGRVFMSDERLTADDGGRGLTPMYELTADGITEAFVGRASIYGVVRVR